MDWFFLKNRVHDIGKNSKYTNSYFEHPRWQLVTLLEELSGFWPHQNQYKQYSLQTLHFLVLFSIFLAVWNKLPELIGVDTTMALECGLFMMFLFGLIIKLMFATTGQSRRKEIYKHISEHFKTIIDPEEAALLNDFADQGFRYTAIYMCIVCICVGIFDSIPILRPFYNYVFLHEELKLQLPLPMDYGFDHKKYWYVIALDYLMFVYSGILVDFAYDLAFMLQTRHVQALFKIVRIRLNKVSELVDKIENDEMSDDDANKSYSIISSAIDLHSECLDLVQMIEETYTTNWFMILLLSTGAFGAATHVVSAKLYDPIELFRYICAFSVVIAHFQVIFSQGQRIVDSSSMISEACYECKWYGLPRESCQLLSVMMMRSSTPCQLTGANLFPLSTETFGKMLKAGLSYYTVFQT